MKFNSILDYFDNDLNKFCIFLECEYHERGIDLDLKVTGNGNDIEVIINDKSKFIDFLNRFRECLESAIVCRLRIEDDSADYFYHENLRLEEILHKINNLMYNKDHA